MNSAIDTMNAERKALDAWHEQATREAIPARCKGCAAAKRAAMFAHPGSFNHGICCDDCRATRDAIAWNALRFQWVMTNKARAALAQGTVSEQRHAGDLARKLKQIEANAASHKSHT